MGDYLLARARTSLVSKKFENWKRSVVPLQYFGIKFVAP